MLFLLVIGRPPRSPLFPYTTLFRSAPSGTTQDEEEDEEQREAARADPLRAQGYERNGSDRKSTRLNSSHSQISYAVFCLKKKTNSIMDIDTIFGSLYQIELAYIM